MSKPESLKVRKHICVLTQYITNFWFYSYIPFSRLEDAIDSTKIQKKVVTVTQTLVDGKVVSESKDVKSSEKIVS